MDWNNKVILIVEDDEVSSILLEELLEDTHVRLIVADNGNEAVKIFRKGPQIDLVIMDIQLPGMDGFEALKAIREIKSNVPVIAQTAFYTAEMETDCLDAGFDDFIAKPLAIQDLMNKISPFLNK